MPYAVAGFQTLSQRFLTSTIASQLYYRSAILYLLAGMSGQLGNGDALRIGRPDEGIVLSGAPVSQAEKMTLPNNSSYAPRIQAFKTNNTQVIGARANMPTVASPTTLSQGQAPQAAADFNWMMYLSTPLEIWQFDLDMALQSDSKDGSGLAVGTLITQATAVGMNEHIDQLSARLLYGSPTNQFVQPWDDLQGVITAGTGSNVYGKVNRATLGSTDPWQPVYNTTFATMDIYAIIQDMNYTQGMAGYAGGVDVVLLGKDHYVIAKNQVLARDKTCVMVQGFPEMAKMGCVREVLRVDNVYVMWEPFLDTTTMASVCQAGTTTPLYTARPTYVIGLNMKQWKLMFKPNYNMKVQPFKDISNLSLAAPKASISFIETCAILSCDRPAAGVALYTGIA